MSHAPSAKCEQIYRLTSGYIKTKNSSAFTGKSLRNAFLPFSVKKIGKRVFAKYRKIKIFKCRRGQILTHQGEYL